MKSKSKLSGLGLALGAALGLAFGLVAGNIGAWLAVGLVIGMVMGASLRRKPPECPHCAALQRSHEAVQRRAS